jgi:hypothetical protein
LNGRLTAGTGLYLSAKQTTNLDQSDLSTMKGGRRSLTRKKHKQQMLSMRFIVVTFCLSPLLVQGRSVVGDIVELLRNCATQVQSVSTIRALCRNGVRKTNCIAHSDASRASNNTRYACSFNACVEQARFALKNKGVSNIAL